MLESTSRSAGPVNGKVILNESYLQTFCGTACNVIFVLAIVAWRTVWRTWVFALLVQ